MRFCDNGYVRFSSADSCHPKCVVLSAAACRTLVRLVASGAVSGGLVEVAINGLAHKSHFAD